MFELAWIGVPAAICGFVYFLVIGQRLLPKRADHARAATENLRSYQFELRIPEGSSLDRRTVEAAGLRQLEGAFLAHIIRDGQLFGPVAPNLVLQAGDLLAFSGSADALDGLLRDHELARVVDPVGEENDGSRLNGAEADSPHLPLFEAVVSANSVLHGRSLKEVDFRERFQAVVIGIHRSGRRLAGPLGRIPLETGDLLLLEAPAGFARDWVGSGEFYLVAPIERSEPVDSRRGPWIFGLFFVTVLCAAMGWLPLSVVAFGAAVAAVFLGRLSPREARRSLDLSVLFVIAGAFGISAAMSETKLDEFLAAQLNYLNEAVAPLAGPIGTLAVLYIVTNLLTEILTNNVAAVMVFPIGLEVATRMNLEPRACAIVIAVAASASFATPIGYQTNLMVMGPGGYRFRDYLRVGLPLNVLVMLLTLCIVRALWV